MADQSQPEMGRALRRAYQVFADPHGGAGKEIMADLDSVFGGNPFVAGSADVTARNCGCLAVVAYLYAQMDRANAPDEKQETSDGENR
jgi:hypothetical protein